MFYSGGDANFNSMQCRGIIHLKQRCKLKKIADACGQGLYTLYRFINSSTLGTSVPKSFNMVLYCDNNRVHAGEYLFKIIAVAQYTKIGKDDDEKDALRCRYGISNVCSFEIVEGNYYAK